MFFTGVINLYLWCDLIYSEMWKLLEFPAFTSCRSVKMYTATKSFDRFRQPKSVEDDKKSVDNVVVYGFRGMGTESISEILYFGTRRPFYHERLWRRSSNFGHGYYRYVCIHRFWASFHCAHFSGIYYSHWRVVYCFSLGIQTHVRDAVYILWLVVDHMNY